MKYLLLILLCPVLVKAQQTQRTDSTIIESTLPLNSLSKTTDPPAQTLLLKKHNMALEKMLKQTNAQLQNLQPILKKNKQQLRIGYFVGGIIGLIVLPQVFILTGVLIRRN